MHPREKKRIRDVPVCRQIMRGDDESKHLKMGTNSLAVRCIVQHDRNLESLDYATVGRMLLSRA